MPIHQINLFICELCGIYETSCVETGLYDDPVVKKDGWGHKNDMLLCPICMAAQPNPDIES